MIFCGPPGSGKTMTLTSTLSNATDIELVGINFSAGTTPELILQIFSQYCEIKKSTYGLIMKPKRADKRLVVFCDEVNLPANDKYGTQRVITFIRQMVSARGFWRASDCQWITLERIQFVAACNPPTDPGRVVLSNRFLRYAPVLLVDYPSEISLKQIYGTFTRALLTLHPNLSKFHQAVTDAMVEIYLTSQRWYTTETQSHYIYSPRELSRYIRALYEATIHRDLMTPEDLVRLFVHEGYRLFYDRLVEDYNRASCLDLFKDVCKRCFSNINLDVALRGPILFTPWLTRSYMPVDQIELREFVRHRMKLFYEEELNVKLVVFDDVLEHVLHIDRVLRQPMGHVLLIGTSGSGKSTLTHFVAWMNDMVMFKIKISKAYSFEDFEEDLRVVMKKAGCEDKQICFVFDEMAALGPAMIERMNALLASGEVPGLFEGEEHTSLMQECHEAARRDNKTFDNDEEVYKHFVKTVQRNLHIVFTMNPVGSDFASQATTSPALFNRCVVNWMGTWSPEALTQVCAEFTKEIDFSVMGKGSTVDRSEPGMESVVDSNHAACVNSFTTIYKLVDNVADALRKRHDRHNYITPRSFLDSIHHFKMLLEERKEQLRRKEAHLTVGIQKLAETRESVKTMQLSLAEKQQELVSQNLRAEEKLKEIMQQQEEAKKKQDDIQKVGKEVQVRQAEVAEEQSKVNEELAQVEPQLEEAKTAVTQIRKQTLDEVRALPNPPKLVRQTMEMVVLLLGEPESSWEVIRKIMRKDDFISSIIGFDGTALSNATRSKVQSQFFSDPAFTFEAVNNASKACGPLFKWGEAQISYNIILESVQPLTNKIKALQKETQKLVDKKVALDKEYDAMQDFIDGLKKQYSQIVADAERIKSDMAAIQSKVDRSVKLLDSLLSEKERWEDQTKGLGVLKSTIVGDSILGGVFLAYGGYFDQSERALLIAKWASILRQHGVRSKDDLSMTALLTHPDQTHEWAKRGLPSDDLCIENAAIIERYNRYPLIIDPSGQSMDFLVSAKDQNIVKTSFLDDSFVKNLESAIRFGSTLIVQDVESLDPIINPILNKQLIKVTGRLMVPVGPNNIDYNPGFKLFLVTKDPNPLFSPDLCSRVTFANFTVTASSMENKCLSMIVKTIRPDVEQRRVDLIAAQGELAYRLVALEIQLLDALSNAKGNLLENNKLMSTLETIKSEAAEVQAKAADNEKVILEVNATMQRFRPLAIMCRRLYFALEQHSHIHFMYQFSLASFMGVFSSVLEKNKQSGTSTTAKAEAEALKNLRADLLKQIYEHFKLSLKKDDRELLAFRICEVNGQDTPTQLPQAEADFFFKGSASVVTAAVLPEKLAAATKHAETIANEIGLDVVQRQELGSLLTLSSFESLADHILKNKAAWRMFMSNDNAPPSWVPKGDDTNEIILRFRDLVVLKVLRPDRVVSAVRAFVNLTIPNLIVQGSDASLESIVTHGSPLSPIFLAAAPGYDSSAQVEELASTKRHAISSMAMGTSEAASHADKAIVQASRMGDWVMLKNVHLDPGFLAQLSKLLPRLNPHPEMRVFLTSEIHPKIPRTLLLQSRLLMLEAAGGVKANLMRTLSQLTPEKAERAPVGRTRVYFLLAWIHAILQERVRYHPVGWTRTYEFGESDRRATFDIFDEWLAAAAKGAQNFSPAKIPWQAIRTLIAQSTYGGRVENEFDRMLLEAFLAKYLQPHAFDHAFPLFETQQGKVALNDGQKLSDYVKFVEALPDVESPLWLGLPPLAEQLITTRKGEALLSKILKLRSSFETSSGDLVSDADGEVGQQHSAAWYTNLEKPLSEWLLAVAVSIEPMSESDTRASSPVFRCFNREIRALTNLRNLVITQFTTLQAIGSAGLKATANQHQMISMLSKEIIPKEFKIYPVKDMGISEWFVDLNKRLRSLSTIIEDIEFCKTKGVWLGGLMSPEAYITATRQYVAQKLKVSLQDLVLELKIGVTKPAENAFIVKGLMIEGAAFENGKVVLSNEMASPLPDSQIVWNKVDGQPFKGLRAPVYLNSSRQELAFSARIQLPDNVDKNAWYQRGLAIVLWSRQAEGI